MKKEELEQKVEALQEEKLDKIVESVEKINERLGSIDITLVKQASQLEYHIHRTNLAEENIRILREELRPVEAHVERVNGVLRAIGLVATIVGMVAGAVKIFFAFS